MNNSEAQEFNDRTCKEVALAYAALQVFQDHWEKVSAYFQGTIQLDERKDDPKYKQMAANIESMIFHIGLKSAEIEALLLVRSLGQMHDRGCQLLKAQINDTEQHTEN